MHIPKTAGQSVERTFLDLVGLSWETRDALLLRQNTDRELGPPKLAHLTAAEYVSAGYVTPTDFELFYKFSFVRNPWARIVSEYRFRRHARRFDFKSFLQANLPEPGSDQYIHLRPQYDFLYAESGRCLVDFVGRFESLQADFNKVCRDLGIDEMVLPHTNSSPSDAPPRKREIRKYLWYLRQVRRQRANTFDHYTEYYDAESIAWVAAMYERDIDTFGYRFGDPSR